MDGIQFKTEKKIWEQGINDWDCFLNTNRIRGISKIRKDIFDKEILGAKQALKNEDLEFFCKWPSSHNWRLYDYFKDETLFLDIEVGKTQKDIIIVGMFDGFNTKVMIKCYNLDKRLLLKELEKYKLLITFNGSSFDIPALEKYFGFKLNIPHIDLKHLCLKLGLKGGLKAVEKKLNVYRPKHLRGHPIDLWKAFMASGNKEYLDLMIQYNEEDVVNLKLIIDYCYKKLIEEVKK